MCGTTAQPCLYIVSNIFGIYIISVGYPFHNLMVTYFQMLWLMVMLLLNGLN